MPGWYTTRCREMQAVHWSHETQPETKIQRHVFEGSYQLWQGVWIYAETISCLWKGIICWDYWRKAGVGMDVYSERVLWHIHDLYTFEWKVYIYFPKRKKFPIECFIESTSSIYLLLSLMLAMLLGSAELGEQGSQSLCSCRKSLLKLCVF